MKRFPQRPHWRQSVRLLSFLFALATARAQTSTNAGTLPARLSVADARRIALERNWDLLAAKSDVDLATAQRFVARELPNPTFSFSTTKINSDGRPNHTAAGNGLWDRSYDTVAALNQLIEIGGKRRARLDSTRAGLRGAGARFADARRLLEAGVTQVYVAVLLADEKQRTLAESAASLRKEANIAAIRQRAGDISMADQSQIEIAADRLELDAAAAATDARNARLNLEVLLGERQPRGMFQPSDTLMALAGPRDDESNAPSADFNRPDIAAAEAARAKAEADLRLQQAMRIPDPTFLVQYEHQPADQPNTVGIGVSFPLPLWNFNRGNISAARASLAQASTAVEKIRAQAVADTANARNVYATAVARWQRYRDELLPKSRQVRAAVAFAYEKGGASLLDLLSAERNDNDVRLANAQAAADTANALATLRAALNQTETISPQKP